MISLAPLAGSKLTKNGVIIITANHHRTQEANHRDALDRLIAMIPVADQRPKYRVITRPGRAANMRRTDSKVKRGNVKKLRYKKISDED
jgi:ribosome-associated protein